MMKLHVRNVEQASTLVVKQLEEMWERKDELSTSAENSFGSCGLDCGRDAVRSQ